MVWNLDYLVIWFGKWAGWFGLESRLNALFEKLAGMVWFGKMVGWFGLGCYLDVWFGIWIVWLFGLESGLDGLAWKRLLVGKGNGFFDSFSRSII